MSIIKQESIIHASSFFLTSSQNGKNKIIDDMFSEQPSIMKFTQYLDEAIKKEPTKEVILQLMCIFYYSILHQKIKLKKIPIDDLLDSLHQSSEMKKYFHNLNYNFDDNSFGTFFEGYPQKEILKYTYFAINEQFRNHIETEDDGLFVFYLMKTLGETIDKNIVK